MGEEKKYLKSLTKAVKEYIDIMDDIMKQPSTVERGKDIARLLNHLEMANDRARLFGLGQSLKSKSHGALRRGG